MRGDAYGVRHMALQQFIYDRHGLPEPEARVILDHWRFILHGLYQQAEGADGKINDDVTQNVVKKICCFVDRLYQVVGHVPVEILPSRITLSQQ